MRHVEARAPRSVGERERVHLGAPAQHPAREAGVVGIGLEADDATRKPGEREGEEPLIDADVDRGAAPSHQPVEDRELRLAGRRLVGDPTALCTRSLKELGVPVPD